jgi:glycosyltransferase involved in cell wall biosynthesis
MLIPGFPARADETDCLPAVQEFVKAIGRRNPEVAVHVVSFHYPYKAGTSAWNGVQVRALAGRNRPFPLRYLTWWQAEAHVRRLMRTENVRVLHSFWLAECTYVAARLAKVSGIRHVATICGQDALPENPYLKRLRFSGMTITAGSPRAADAFYRSTGRQVDRIIPTGLDTSALSRAPEGSRRTIDILGAGSLSVVKDFGSFVDIVAAVAAGRPSLRCVILGDGPERAALERRIAAHGLTDVVKLAGHVRREEVLATMRTARILLHTSRYEGQGYVLLEALDSGMRVVCRDVGYTGGHAAAIACTSDEEMVAQLAALLDAPAAAPEPAGVETIDSTARAIEEIYEFGGN